MRVMALFASAAMLIYPVMADARPFTPEDIVKEIGIRGADISPDGSKVVYTVSSADTGKDENVSHIWMAQWDGSGTRQLTWREGENESGAKFSPDGSQIGFLSSRADEDKETRLWLMPLAGGEARPLDGIEGSVEDFAWSPDGKYLALIVGDKEPEPKKDADGDEIPPVIVIDRYKFKQDGAGYLGKERSRLFLYDIATGKTVRMTDGDFDEGSPSWSPDSSKVAFVSIRAEDPDRTVDSNIYIADITQPGAAPFQLTTSERADGEGGAGPVWSPDGKTIAYVRAGDPELIWYAANELLTIPATGGTPTRLTPTLDRNVYAPYWTPDGKTLRFIMEDDGKQVLASVPAKGGAVTTVLGGEFVLRGPTISKNGHVALLSSSPTMPYELQALDDGKLRPLTSHNADWLKDIDLGIQQFVSYPSKDGTEVHGFVMLPPEAEDGAKLPTLLHPHGGPAAQYDYAFDSWQQIFAGAGYAVLTPNPRGSTGRGTEYSAGIDAAWGTVDVEDDLAAVDYAVAEGFADPDKLFVGGWSYGGMSTNYLVAKDTRFKAAMAGASIGSILAGYGTDQYILEYELELGTPWDNPEPWFEISFPLLKNQTIVTPTMFMVGEEDVNVPTLASEQMYQALKSRGIDTQLIIYPGQNHGIRRPSYEIDLMTRWLGWNAKYMD